jgi:hypothetical protein
VARPQTRRRGPAGPFRQLHAVRDDYEAKATTRDLGGIDMPGLAGRARALFVSIAGIEDGRYELTEELVASLIKITQVVERDLHRLRVA